MRILAFIVALSFITISNSFAWLGLAAKQEVCYYTSSEDGKKYKVELFYSDSLSPEEAYQTVYITFNHYDKFIRLIGADFNRPTQRLEGNIVRATWTSTSSTEIYEFTEAVKPKKKKFIHIFSVETKQNLGTYYLHNCKLINSWPINAYLSSYKPPKGTLDPRDALHQFMRKQIKYAKSLGIEDGWGWSQW